MFKVETNKFRCHNKEKQINEVIKTEDNFTSVILAI